MSITVEQQPQTYSPVYNGLFFLLSSTNVALPNFTIQARIKNGATLLATLNIPPRPDNNLVLLDAGRIVESQVSADIQPIEDGAGWRLSDSFVKYTVELQESFGSTPAVSGATTTITPYAFNGSLRYFDFNDYDQDDYLVQTGGNSRYLTNMPASVPVRLTQGVELGVFTEQDGPVNPVYRATIKTYGANGALKKTATVDNPNINYAVDANRFPSFICGPADLNNLTLSTGTQPLMDEGVYKYTVQFEDDDGPNPSTRIQEFIIDRSCSKYEYETTLYFLNKLGRFDSFGFSLANQQTFDNEKRDYDKYPGQITGNSFAFNPMGEQKTTYDVTETERWRLTADYLPQDVAQWLTELVVSPKVFMFHPIYERLVEVKIDLNSYTPPLTPIDRLFNFEINVTLSAINFGQRQ